MFAKNGMFSMRPRTSTTNVNVSLLIPFRIADNYNTVMSMENARYCTLAHWRMRTIDHMIVGRGYNFAAPKYNRVVKVP